VSKEACRTIKAPLSATKTKAWSESMSIKDLRFIALLLQIAAGLALDTAAKFSQCLCIAYPKHSEESIPLSSLVPLRAVYCCLSDNRLLSVLSVV